MAAPAKRREVEPQHQSKTSHPPWRPLAQLSQSPSPLCFSLLSAPRKRIPRASGRGCVTSAATTRTSSTSATGRGPTCPSRRRWAPRTGTGATRPTATCSWGRPARSRPARAPWRRIKPRRPTRPRPREPSSRSRAATPPGASRSCRATSSTSGA